MTHDELRAALKCLGLTQREFASRLGVSPLTVWRWVRGDLAVPKYAAYVVTLLRNQCPNNVRITPVFVRIMPSNPAASVNEINHL
jgi:DNA-binding transcriptional regulator YiaG